MTSPTIDLGQVLSSKEILNLQTLVKSNRDLWTHCSDYWGDSYKGHWLYYLGSAISACVNDTSIYHTFRNRSEPFLIDHTQVLLNRMIAKMCDRFGVTEATHLPNTSLPGFHILINDTDAPIETGWDRYHYDSDLLSDSQFKHDFKKFYSFIAAIELPCGGSGLDYQIDNQNHFFPYETGHGYIWKSDMLHKMNRSWLQPDEYRITFQGHMVVDDTIQYYW